MSNTSVLPCPYSGCGEDIPIVMTDYVEGGEVECPTCHRRAELWKVPAPTKDDFGTKVWDLRALE